MDNVLSGLDETKKKGDDYAARVYVVFSTGPFFWQSKALNYVWSGGRAMGSHWPNAYTEKSMNIAVRTGESKVGAWVTQSRNVREDFKRYFGKDIREAVAVALMTDTDNSGAAARAYYGDIRLSASCGE